MSHQQEDAIVRLVRALNSNGATNNNVDGSVDLARRILESQLGSIPLSSSSSYDDEPEFASAWIRRIQTQLHQDHHDIANLYGELSQACQGKDQQLPARIMNVLTKCIGRGNAYEPASTQTGKDQEAKDASNRHANAQPSTSSKPTTGNSKNNVKMFDPNLPRSQLAKAVQYEEQQVLRELLYALQGIDGERIKFYYPPADATEFAYEGIRVASQALQFVGTGPSRLGSGAMDALKICGEAGWLVRRLQNYVNFHLTTCTQGHNSSLTTTGSSPGSGQIARALARAVASELEAYYHFLTELESHLDDWSLRQYLVQIQRQPVLQRLTVLTMLTEALPPGKNGGILLSALHKHSLHGDSRHRHLVQRILYPTSQPWFHMLYLWTTQGLLPASWGRDFFVTLQYQGEDSQYTNNKDDNRHLWHDKYTMDKSQIPSSGIFDPELVRPSFVIGKGINFIRSCLNQIGWTLQLEEEAAATTEEEMKTGNDSELSIMERLGYRYVADPLGMHLNPQLTRTLLKAEKLVHSHILESLRNEHHLLQHLFALKQFLFHGQGDFFSSLLEGLYSEYGCGTKRREASANASFVTGHAVAGVHRYQLVAILETSLRRTNAKDLPAFCLERLKVEMLPFESQQTNSPTGGLFSTPNLLDIHENDSEEDEDHRTVWDIFMLDYTVPGPLLAIVHEKAMQQYKLVYSFLFSLRKVEYMLNRTWRQSASLQHALQTMAQNNGLQTSSSVGYAHATVLLRKISMTRQAMTHFCVNLKSYCMLEVLEGGWKELQERLETASTLDEAIHAHDLYLEGICRKTLLSKGRKKSRSRKNAPDMQQVSNNKFRQLFGSILGVATDFCVRQERLFDEALDAAERVAQRRREAEQRMTHGQWGFENEQDLAEEESFFGLANSSELAEVVKLSEAFHHCAVAFLEALDAKVHGRSQNMSNTIIHDADDDDECYGNLLQMETSGEEQDVDSLRFLIQQLDHNHYYGMLHPSG